MTVLFPCDQWQMQQVIVWVRCLQKSRRISGGSLEDLWRIQTRGQHLVRAYMKQDNPPLHSQWSPLSLFSRASWDIDQRQYNLLWMFYTCRLFINGSGQSLGCSWGKLAALAGLMGASVTVIFSFVVMFCLCWVRPSPSFHAVLCFLVALVFLQVPETTDSVSDIKSTLNSKPNYWYCLHKSNQTWYRDFFSPKSS